MVLKCWLYVACGFGVYLMHCVNAHIHIVELRSTLQPAKVENMFVPACVNHNCRSIIIGDLFKVSPCIKRSCGCQALLALTWHARLNIKNNWPNVPTQVSKMNVNMPEQLRRRQRLRLSCNFFIIYKNHPNP